MVEPVWTVCAACGVVVADAHAHVAHHGLLAQVSDLLATDHTVTDPATGDPIQPAEPEEP